MAKNKLGDLAVGDIFRSKKINDIHNALSGPIVGRSTKGQPLDGEKLGNSSFAWTDVNAYNFFEDNTELNLREFNAKPNSILSGASRSGVGSQPVYIIPAGVAGGNECTIKASVTPLVYKVNDTIFTLNADIVITGLLTQETPLGTAFQNLLFIPSPSEEQKVWGEPIFGSKVIQINTASATVVSNIGRWATFQPTSVLPLELYFCKILSSTELTHVKRGFYYDELLDPIIRRDQVVLTTINMRRTGWVFLENDLATTDVTYNKPTQSATQPTSPTPATGDYWLDLSTDEWKRFNGSIFVVINRTLVGKVVIDGTDCIGARSEPFYDLPNNISNLKFEKVSNTIMEVSSIYNMVQHDSITSLLGKSKFRFDNSTDFADADFTDASDITTMRDRVGLYLTDKFEPKLSDHLPYFLSNEGTHKHPHQNWRCLAVANVNTQFDDVYSLSSNDFNRKVPVVTLTFGDQILNSNIYTDLPLVSIDQSNGSVLRYETGPQEFWFMRTGLYEFSLEMSSITNRDLINPQVIDTIKFAIFEGANLVLFEFPFMAATRTSSAFDFANYYTMKRLARLDNNLFNMLVKGKINGSTSPQLVVNLSDIKLNIKYIGDSL